MQCLSLPVRHRGQVLEMGIDTYNQHCRSIVTRYSKEWEVTIKRLGRWIDFENDYKTMVSERYHRCLQRAKETFA